MGSAATIGNVIKNKGLTEMAMGYARSRALVAAARLGVADALGDKERSVDQLASECSADRDSLHRLLRALASFGVVIETQPSRFTLTAQGKPLRKDVPNSEWSAVVFWGDLLADSWSHMTECVRSGNNAMQIMQRDKLPSRWAQDPKASEIFWAVMGTAPDADYMPIAKAWDFSGYNIAADLGGGGGALIIAVLNANPHLKGMLVDRPEPLSAAESRFEANGLSNRCQLISADLTQSVPSGADVYMLKHVLHGFVDDAAVGVLRNCKDVMPNNGRLLLVEFVLPDVVATADEHVEQRLMSDLNMMVVTGGKERSADDWKKLVMVAGLTCERIVPVSGDLVSIIECSA